MKEVLRVYLNNGSTVDFSKDCSWCRDYHTRNGECVLKILDADTKIIAVFNWDNIQGVALI